MVGELSDRIVKLNDGNEIPLVGMGTWKLEGETLYKALEYAYSIGYRHIDTAAFYQNESVIGDFVSNQKECRKELFITTKLWNDCHDDVLGALNGSLERLKMEYVDLYLVHWPVNLTGEFNLEKVWRQMEKLIDMGKARSIGVSNFGVKNLEKLLSFCRIKPVINQIELHPYLPQVEIRNLCRRHCIKVGSYSSFGSDSGQASSLLNDPTLNEIAGRLKCTVRQVILGYLVKNEIIVIPRSKSYEHLKMNWEIVEIGESDVENIDSIERRIRFIDPVSFGEHRFD